MIATAFADLGFDVDVGRCSRPRTRSPARPPTTMCTSWACRRWPPPPHPGAGAAGRPCRGGRPDIMIVVGGVIPPGTRRAVRRRVRRRSSAGHGHRRLGGQADRQARRRLDLELAASGSGSSGLTKLMARRPIDVAALTEECSPTAGPIWPGRSPSSSRRGPITARPRRRCCSH